MLTKTVSPNVFLLGTKFEKIKKEVKLLSCESDDFETEIVLHFSKYSIGLNYTYELEIYYEEMDKEIELQVNNIEKIIQNQINKFKFKNIDLLS